MKKILFIMACCILPLQQATAQLVENLSIGLESNGAWYNDDKKKGDFYDAVNQDGDRHLRFNNYLKLDYRFLENFTATVQIESYEPYALLNYSPKFRETKLGTYSLNYKNEKLDVTAGHFYEQFGSGLILRSWEDRQLGINNALFGGKVSYSPIDDVSLTALYGKHRVGFDFSEGEIFGFDTEIDLSNILDFDSSSLSLGLSYVGRKEDTNIENPEFNELTNSFSGRLDYSNNSFYAGVEYVHRGEDLVVQKIGNQSIFPDDFVKTGSAILFNAGFSKKGFGVDATLRRLENMSFYSDRQEIGNIYFENIGNYTPGLTKQHDYLLTNIFVYQAQSLVNFNFESQTYKIGEIGGQLDVFYKIKKDTPLGGKYGTKIALNLSYWAGLKGDINTDFANPDYDMDILGFGDKYFSDISLEVRKKWSKNWSSIFYYVNQYYNKSIIEGNFSADPIKSNIGVVETTYKMGKGRSLRFEAQKLWSDTKDHDWIGGTVEFNINRRFSVYVNDIYNSGEDKDTEETHYYNFGGSYTKGATRVGINYGRQRAGLICVGGVCRFVPEATGLTMNLTMSF